MRFLDYLIHIFVNGLIAMLISWYFYHYKKRDLLGGYWMTTFFAFLGTIIFSLLSTQISQIIYFLQNPPGVKVNLIASTLGGFATAYIYNKINHDREKQDW